MTLQNVGGNLMFATILAAGLALLGFMLLAVSAFLGVTHIADWTVNAAQVSLSLAVCIYLGYFLAACVSEVRNMR
jgi:hypothetical protein